MIVHITEKFGGRIEIANKSDNLNALGIAHIFDRFYAAVASRTGQSTGLGLAIAKELLARMNGNITAETQRDALILKIGLKGLGQGAEYSLMSEARKAELIERSSW